MVRSIVNILNHKKVVPFVFLIPFLTIFVVFKVYPVILAIIMSFQNFQGVTSQEWVGLTNYENVFELVRFNQALANTTIYTIGTLLILIPVPLVLAVLLDTGRVVQSTVFRTLIFLPALTSLVVAGTVFRLILAEGGFVNLFLSSVLERNPCAGSKSRNSRSLHSFWWRRGAGPGSTSCTSTRVW
ncbi:MAG: sugar ABC transporter permease [Chloroflexi bacterium]|nr:sugar ABC transporter permease [Chloroflexota bacterium]